MSAAAPPEIPATFLTIAEAARVLPANHEPGSTIVLMEAPASALRLAEAGFVVPALNLGGLHRDGGQAVTPYLFLSPADLSALRALRLRGTQIYAQDLPDGKRLEAGDFLGE